MAFEKVEKYSRATYGEVYLRSGRLILPPEVLKLIGNPEQLSIWYDPVADCIGLDVETGENGYAVARSSRSAMFISCEKLIKQLGLKGTYRVPLTMTVAKEEPRLRFHRK